MSTVPDATALSPQNPFPKPQKWDKPSWIKVFGIGTLLAAVAACAGTLISPTSELQKGTVILQTVANRLHVDAETTASFQLLPISFNSTEKNDTERVAYVDSTSTVFINPAYYPILLEGDDSSKNLTQQEIQGILAHEVSHVALGHLKRPPTIIASTDSQQDEAFRLLRLQDEMAQSRRDERAADLYTLQDPWLAKGLLQVMTKWSKEDHKEHLCFLTFFRHPSTERRVQYLEDGLCRVAPENDPDRCFLTVMAHDPVVNGRLSAGDKESIRYYRTFLQEKRMNAQQTRLDRCKGQTMQWGNKTYEWDESFLAEEAEVEPLYKQLRIAYFSSPAN